MHLNLSDGGVHVPTTVCPHFLFVATGKGRRERERMGSALRRTGVTDPFEGHLCISITRNKGGK